MSAIHFKPLPSCTHLPGVFWDSFGYPRAANLVNSLWGGPGYRLTIFMKASAGIARAGCRLFIAEREYIGRIK